MSTHIHRLETSLSAASASRSRTAVSSAGKGNPVTMMLRRLRNRVARVRQRRAAIAELSRLSERQLHDIGVHRHQIPELVDGVLRRQFDRDE